MKIMCLSDLHLGDGTFNDYFGWNDDEFIELLQNKINEKKIEKIYLLGDVYELLRFNEKKVRTAHSKLIDYFENSGGFITLIEGNHDIILRHRQFITIEENGNKIHLEHGNMADPSRFYFFNIVSMIFSRLFIFICTKVEPLRLFIKKAHGSINEERERRNNYAIYYLLYSIRRLNAYDVQISGHTHHMESVESFFSDRKRIYLNTGKCVGRRFQGVILDTTTLEYELFKLKA